MSCIYDDVCVNGSVWHSLWKRAHKIRVRMKETEYSNRIMPTTKATDDLNTKSIQIKIFGILLWKCKKNDDGREEITFSEEIRFLFCKNRSYFCLSENIHFSRFRILKTTGFRSTSINTMSIFTMSASHSSEHFLKTKSNMHCINSNDNFSLLYTFTLALDVAWSLMLIYRLENWFRWAKWQLYIMMVN